MRAGPSIRPTFRWQPPDGVGPGGTWVRALGLGTLVIALLAMTALLDQDTGVGIWRELRQGLAGSTARVDELIRENEALRREIEDFEASEGAIDRAIREELGLALPGEIVVRFVRRAESVQEP